jgi:transcriptional regulator with XRE-family HTH domain
MKAVDWIDRVKDQCQWDTDYRVAKELGFSRNTIGNFRSGRSSTMDEETAVKVAEALKLNPAGIVLDQLAERSKNQAVRSTLAAEAQRLCALCKVIFAPNFVAM